jgi:carboxypeptidase Taq
MPHRGAHARADASATLARILFATMHEFGHGLYEHQASTRTLERTPLARAACRSACTSRRAACGRTSSAAAPFWRWFYPAAAGALPDALGTSTTPSVPRGQRGRPSLIRVDADEATYNLHIILRFELEQELLAGTRRRSSDLPEAWNERMQRLPRRRGARRRARRAAGRALVDRASATSRPTRSAT